MTRIILALIAGQIGPAEESEQREWALAGPESPLCGPRSQEWELGCAEARPASASVTGRTNAVFNAQIEHSGRHTVFNCTYDSESQSIMIHSDHDRAT
jgi:hypothetical protein